MYYRQQFFLNVKYVNVFSWFDMEGKIHILNALKKYIHISKIYFLKYTKNFTKYIFDIIFFVYFEIC